MKKIFAIISIFTIILHLRVTLAYAGITPILTPKTTPKVSPTPSEAPSALDKIEKIKEMVASRVAELKLVEKRGIMGTAQQTTSTQITIADIKNTIHAIDTDELTKFQEGETVSKSFGISDIKKGDLISAIGLYNKQTQRLLALAVTKMKPSPVLLFGEISEKDAKSFSFTLTQRNAEKKTVDIEVSTKTRLYAKKGGVQKSGFSKITVGQSVFVVGYPDPKEEGVINASRIIHFEEGIFARVGT